MQGPESHGFRNPIDQILSFPFYQLFFFSYLFLWLLSFFSTNYFSTPPGVCLNKKSPSHFTEQITWSLAPGVGFEPTRPEGAQADSRAYSRHGPACKADCPVPGSGIPAKHATVLTTIFPFGTRSIDPETRQRRIASRTRQAAECSEKNYESGDGSEPANNP